MIIREVKEGDVSALSELAGKTYAETFGDGLTPEQLSSVMESTRSERYFRSKIDTDTILVALDDGRLVGYIQIGEVGYDVEGVKMTDRDQAIHSLYVHSDFQGKGVGKSLMDAAFAYPRIRKAENVYVDVYKANTRAFNFYYNYGFRAVGKVEVLIEGESIGFDLIMMKPSG